LGKDILGSVWGVTDEYGVVKERYEYDAFGEAYEGDLSGGMNLGYTGKPYETVTGMYNYGYRDYKAELGRFTTEDPVRDGANWFAYVDNDPVNYIDLWGLWIKNADGTYTAEPGDTLSGLSALATGSGNNWERYEFTDDPSKTIDPRALQIGSVISVDNMVGFANADQAAANIMMKINPISQAAYVEYGGLTYQQDGTAYYTKPTTDGQNDSWDPKPQIADSQPGLPQYTLKTTGQPVTGWYHTHPNPVGATATDEMAKVFSGWIASSGSPTGYEGDLHTSDVSGITAYMIDPDNNMQKYEPAPGGHLQYHSSNPNRSFNPPDPIQGTISPLQPAATNCGR
jgi:RHS repeat-associated protein